MDNMVTPLELARRSIQEAFARSLGSGIEDPIERRDRILAAHLRRIRDHFNQAPFMTDAVNSPLTPYSKCLPLALACHAFAGARGDEYHAAPDSAKVLLEMGADAFAKSPAPPDEIQLRGRYLFASDELNALEIALAHSDAGLILAIAPLAGPTHFLPEHWSAYELFCDFPDPLRSKCDEVLKALAERGFLLSVIDLPTQNGEELRGKGKSGKRL